MNKILLLLLGFSCSTLALEQNPIAPPRVEIADKFGVNLESGQLARALNTVAIGGELGLSHSAQLYTDLWADGNYGFVDAFAGSVTAKRISGNVVNILTNGDAITAFRDTGTYQSNYPGVYVMRAYGPAGSHDFMVYKDGLVGNPNTTFSGYVYRPVGDTRHSLIESPDRTYVTWTTPDGTETKYDRTGVPGNWPASTGGRIKEVTYPNGFKVRISSKAVTTNTGFMLKYHFNTPGLNTTPSQIVGINLANQYCAVDAATCSTTGWPLATFTWPTGTPNIFKQPNLPSSNYLITLATSDGITEIQYQPENLCIDKNGHEDATCAANATSGWSKWSPRLRSIKTAESTIPNYQYTYENMGTTIVFATLDGHSPFWHLNARTGQITNAVLNGTDTEFYAGPSESPGTLTRNSGDITVVSARYEPNVINSVRTRQGGTYIYHPDLRKVVEKYYPVAGRGPNQHYYYNGPRGNLNQIKAIDSSGNETLLQEASYAADCTYPKTCNKPLTIKDARGNVTTYEYDPQGRFGNPTKITAPANKNGVRASTVYNYAPMYAYYKKDGDTIGQDPDPVWMLTSEHTCRTSEITSTSCVGGELDRVMTSYYYGPQNSAQPNNLLLRGKSLTADGTSIRVWCYEYDKYGKLIGEIAPKGNSTDLQSCQ